MSENIYLPIIQAYIDHGFSPIPHTIQEKVPAHQGVDNAIGHGGEP